MSAGFWWVNHSHTYGAEIAGSYLWFANKAHKSKARSESEKNTQKLLPGDVIFSFAAGEIGAVGVVVGTAREAAKPKEFESLAEHAEAQSGWTVPVRFTTLATPLRSMEARSMIEMGDCAFTPVWMMRDPVMTTSCSFSSGLASCALAAVAANKSGNKPICLFMFIPSWNVGSPFPPWRIARIDTPGREKRKVFVVPMRPGKAAMRWKEYGFVDSPQR